MYRFPLLKMTELLPAWAYSLDSRLETSAKLDKSLVLFVTQGHSVAEVRFGGLNHAGIARRGRERRGVHHHAYGEGMSIGGQRMKWQAFQGIGLMQRSRLCASGR